MPRHAAPEFDRNHGTRRRSSQDSEPSKERLSLSPAGLSAIPSDKPLVVVAPRLRSLLLAATVDDETAYGAVNVLRWQRPLWADAPTALSPVTVQKPRDRSNAKSRTLTLVVESGPNYAHSLLARRVMDVPATARTVSLDGKPAGVTRLLVRLVETGRLRVPVCSRTYRLLAGDVPDSPRERRTLCHLSDRERTFRVDRTTPSTRQPPWSALVARALPTAADAAFTVALPPINRETARYFGTCVQSPNRTISVRSLPDQISALEGDYEYVLTPGGAYAFSVSRD